MIDKKIKYHPYLVKDMSLADWGRKEIKLAEAEMPGDLKASSFCVLS